MNDVAKGQSLFNIGLPPQPYYFTATTGPANICSIEERHVNWIDEIPVVLQALKEKKILNLHLAVVESVDHAILARFEEDGFIINKIFSLKSSVTSGEVFSLSGITDASIFSGAQALVVLATKSFSLIVRRVEKFLPANILCLPGSLEAIIPSPIQYAGIDEWNERSYILSYLRVSNLKGHFVEFGTFYGRSFFRSYFELQHWLEGKFFAFDSFEGLSEPIPEETLFTNGDFSSHSYGFNQASFEMIASMLEIPKERVIVHKGFYSESLAAHNVQHLKLGPKGVSVCRIDCDLFSSTFEALSFIEPYLDDGALIYFDDWRLCRGSPKLGERGAVKQWLERNTHVDLLEFGSLHWQHQWFIFNRKN